MGRKFEPDVLTNPAVCARLKDAEWVALHTPRFNTVLAAYQAYCTFLDAVLRQACKRLAPEAIVEVRAKKLPSFADKILRKRAVYQDPKDPLPPDPLVRMTDLCGGRVVARTAGDVRTLCRFIEQAFDIDWPNSEDVSQRLKPTEFGYRSVHYVVQVNATKLKSAGINATVPRALMGFAPGRIGPQAGGRPLKAEIQVRTLLEHAAASLGHDTIYKTDLKVPNRIKRHHATLAAMLEGVDSGFGQLLGSLAEFRSSFGAYQHRDAVEREIERLQIVLDCEPSNMSLAVRIAQHALAIGRHEIVVATLARFSGEPHLGVQRALGQALIEMHWDQPKSAKFRKGRSLLEAACAHPPKDSETLCLLAECLAREDDQRARELFHEAIQAEASEPLTLARYLEFEITHHGNDHAVRLSTPMIRAAMDRCRKQIEAHSNLPAAWSSLAFFRLLLGEPFGALDALGHVGALCQGHAKAEGHCGTPGQPCAAGRALQRFRETLRRLRCIRGNLQGYDWCERAVLLMLATRVGDRDAAGELRGMASWKGGKPRFSPEDSVVILAGGCNPELEGPINALKPHLLRGCAGLTFKLLCGGTRAGISGLAGDAAEQSEGRIQAYGYLPQYPPRGSREEENKRRFILCFNSPGADFTPLDPMQGWTDLVAAGLDATRVKLLCYAGREISKSECALALALGARVGVIENKSLPTDRQFLDPAWQDHPNLVRLPMDAMTLRAFLLVDELPLGAEQQKRLEKAARKAHQDYMASATPRDPSLKNWEQLDDALKLSNYHQVAYWEKLLQDHGLRVRHLTDADQAREPLKMESLLGEDGIRLLAEMEHGRWNVERLSRGWRFSPEKDIARKLSPYLVPWVDLSPEIQNYDLEAVRGLPGKLREVGLELERI